MAGAPGSCRNARIYSACFWMLQVLAANGFLYDASLIENPEGESISKGLAARLWPYSLQDGIPQNCEE